LRPLWDQAARLEKQAYAAPQKLKERVALFEQATTEKSLQRHLDQTEDLGAKTVESCEQAWYIRYNLQICSWHFYFYLSFSSFSFASTSF
jgi:hypothetical protein